MSRLHQKMEEARSILEDLHGFTHVARRALQMVDRIKELRLENRRLRQKLAGNQITFDRSEKRLSKLRAETNRLTRTVVANWLLTIKLNHQERAEDKRMSSARAALASSENHLASLRMQLNTRRAALKTLHRTRSVLSKELDRLKQQTIIADRKTQHSEDGHLVVETAIRQLRHSVSDGLRSLLTSN